MRVALPLGGCWPRNPACDCDVIFTSYLRAERRKSDPGLVLTCARPTDHATPDDNTSRTAVVTDRSQSHRSPNVYALQYMLHLLKQNWNKMACKKNEKFKNVNAYMCDNVARNTQSWLCRMQRITSNENITETDRFCSLPVTKTDNQINAERIKTIKTIQRSVEHMWYQSVW